MKAGLVLVLAVVAFACGDDGSNAGPDACVGPSCGMDSLCGNGDVDIATEDCDDGNAVGGDGCSAVCRNECGNGSVDGDERCDDGNLVAGDGCDLRCLVEAGFSCDGEPSECIEPTGACADPFLVMLADNGNGALVGEASGDTTMSTDQVMEAPCDFGDSGSGKDHVWRFTIPDRRDVVVRVDGATAFDSLIRLTRLACDATSEVIEAPGEDGCADDFGTEEVLTYNGLGAGTYYVVIDGYDDMEAGTYKFYVTAAPTVCGNGMRSGTEECDDGNTTTNDGCDAQCNVEAGYVCDDASPSVCTSACGSGTLENGEECDDDNTTPGDRCSATCTLEYDVLEAAEPNDTTPQVIAPTDRQIRGSFLDGDIDLYQFTLTAPSTVEIETYNAIDASQLYTGQGTQTQLDCNGFDSELRLYAMGVDTTMDDLALAHDDEDGDGSCSYVGPNDSDDDDMGMAIPTQGVLNAGTYVIKVTDYFGDTAPYYIVDIKIASSGPVSPIAGDLVLNEFLAADNMSDANCDGQTTGTNDEFIELVNISSKVLDLQGVSIADLIGVTHIFDPNTLLQPGKAIVVYAGGASICADVNGVIANANTMGVAQGLRLNDLGDTLTIKNGSGDTLIMVTYAGQTLNVSSNLSPDVTGTTHVNHDTLTGAVGAYSPGKRANGTAF
ncbi:MAG: DUF4215 domain-containing protein [Kofleriaceae bacterium]